MAKTMNEYLENSKKKPILIEFWAPTCAICKTIEDDLNTFVKEGASKFDFVQIDSPQNMALVEEFDVYNSPTFFVLTNGAILQKFKGNQFDKVKELFGVVK